MTLLVEYLKSLSFDDDKNKRLHKIINTINANSLNGYDIYNIIKLYSFSNGKIEAVNILQNKINIISPAEAQKILSQLNFDNEKMSLLNIIIDKILYNYNDIGMITKSFAFTDDVNEILIRKLNNRPTVHSTTVFKEFPIQPVHRGTETSFITMIWDYIDEIFGNKKQEEPIIQPICDFILQIG